VEFTLWGCEDSEVWRRGLSQTPNLDDEPACYKHQLLVYRRRLYNTLLELVAEVQVMERMPEVGVLIQVYEYPGIGNKDIDLVITMRRLGMARVDYYLKTVDDLGTTMGVIRANDLYNRFSGELGSGVDSADELVEFMSLLESKLGIKLRCKVTFHERGNGG